MDDWLAKTAGDYANEGIAYLQDGRYDLAVRALNRAIQREPNASSYYHRGLAFYFKNDVGSAIADWNQSINLDPNSAMAYRQRGNAYFGQADYDRAVADYNRSIELQPEVSQAYYNRGLVYKAVGGREKAVADFSRVLELHNDPELERSAREQLDELASRHE